MHVGDPLNARAQDIVHTGVIRGSTVRERQQRLAEKHGVGEVATTGSRRLSELHISDHVCHVKVNRGFLNSSEKGRQNSEKLGTRAQLEVK